MDIFDMHNSFGAEKQKMWQEALLFTICVGKNLYQSHCSLQLVGCHSPMKAVWLLVSVNSSANYITVNCSLNMHYLTTMYHLRTV